MILPGLCGYVEPGRGLCNPGDRLIVLDLNVQTAAFQQHILRDGLCLLTVRVDPAVMVRRVDAQTKKQGDRLLYGKILQNLMCKGRIRSVIDGPVRSGVGEIASSVAGAEKLKKRLLSALEHCDRRPPPGRRDRSDDSGSASSHDKDIRVFHFIPHGREDVQVPPPSCTEETSGYRVLRKAR